MTNKKKKPKLVQKWEKQAELEEKFNKILPEKPPPEFEGHPIKDFKASWKEGTKVKLIKERPMEIISYEPKRNLYLIPLININHTKIYFDTKTEEFWQYVFSRNRKRILRKVKLEKHDILNMLTFCIYAIFPNKKLDYNTVIYVTRKLKKKIAQLRRKEEQFYGESKI